MLSYETVEGVQAGAAIDELSSHQALALVDFQLRTASFLALRAHRDSGGPHTTKISRAPGLGSWLQILKAISRSQDLGRKYPSIEQFVAWASARFYLEQPGRVPGTENPKRYRDLLFHGGPQPPGADGSDATAVLQRLCSDLSDRLAQVLGECSTHVISGEKLRRVTAEVDGSSLDLWPLIVADDETSWLIFGQFSEGMAWYNAPGDRRLRVPIRSDHLSTDIVTYLHSGSRDELFSSYISAVRHDLAGFSSPRTDVLHGEEGRLFCVDWVHATSSGDEARTDRFRIGQDDVREWLAPDENWESYGAFLRQLANWPVLRARLLDLVRDADAQDALTLNLPTDKFVPPSLTEIALDGFKEMSKLDTSAVVDHIGDLLHARGNNTEIVFLQGPAGIGKTRALRHLAIASMTRGGDADPLFVYVQAGAVSLKELSEVIDSTVRSTLILTSEIVKALARNGLMVVAIDGFDELLGGLSYDEPLEALRPWLDTLGGRGVLMVSARSAYFFNHYRASIARVGLSAGVSHTVYRLEPWDSSQVRRYFEYCGVDPSEVERLQNSDRELLGLPFFASVVAGSLRDGVQEFPSVGELLVDRYVSRELAKLAGSGSSNLMEHGELVAFFENVAEMMTDERINGRELREAAEFALVGLPIEDRPGLSKRLSALCGLEFDAEGTRSGEFGFEHEIFFDVFFARAAMKQLANGAELRGMGLLGQVPLRPWPASVIAREMRDEVEALLTVSIPERSPDDRYRRMTAGSLYVALLSEGSRSVSVVQAAILDEMRVDLEGRALRFTDVDMDLLALKDGEVTIVDSRLRGLDIDELACARLKIDPVSIPRELRTESGIYTGKRSVRKALAAVGATIVGPALRDESNDGGTFADSSVQIFERLGSGSLVNPVLQRADRLPNDPRMSWVLDHAAEWRRLVDLLVIHELVSLENIHASGPSMVRMRFRVPAGTILEGVRSTDNESIEGFWNAVRAES